VLPLGACALLGASSPRSRRRSLRRSHRVPNGSRTVLRSHQEAK